MSRPVILSGLAALIVLAPVAVGCVHIVAYSAMELFIFSLLALRLWSARPPGPGYLSRTLLLMSPLCLFLLFSMAQMTPFPPGLLERLSPHTLAVRSLFGAVSVHPAAPFSLPLTLSLSATSAALLKWLAYASVFLIAATLPGAGGRSGATAALFGVLFAIGFAEAVYGLSTYLDQTGHLLWFEKRYYTDCVTGTYVNRNHFAGLINLCVPVSLGLLASRLQAAAARRARSTPVRAIRCGHSLSVYFLFLGIVVMVLALIFSMSRMGQFCMVAGAAFLVFLHLAGAWHARRIRGRSMLLVLTAVLCVGVLWGVFKGLRPVEERWQALDGAYGERSLVWWTTWALIRDFRFGGTGLGTYELAYAPYKPRRLGSTIMDHAHNDYLELLSEVGLVGFVPWLSFFLLFFACAIRAWLKRRNSASRLLGAGGLASAFALLVHSLADFNLQIPANAMLLFLVMGLTWRVVNTSFREWAEGRPRGEAQ